MTEIVQIFESAIAKTDCIVGSDFYSLFQACKLIDMMLTLRTGSILMYHWLFFDSVGNTGLFQRLEAKLSSGDVGESNNNEVFYHQNHQNRRPLLTVSSVKSVTELIPFLRSAKTHMSTDFIMIQGVDSEFINLMTEADLLETLEVK